MCRDGVITYSLYVAIGRRPGGSAGRLLVVLLVGGLAGGLTACGGQGGGALELPPGSTMPPGVPAATTKPSPGESGSGVGSASASKEAAKATAEAAALAAARAAAAAASKLGSTDFRSLAADATFRMPKLVGKNLQTAQDQLQARRSYLLDEQDATGQHRVQVIDRDWKVCSQKPSAGKQVLITIVVRLTAVKLDEKCP
jgi:hypothetical protein